MTKKTTCLLPSSVVPKAYVAAIEPDFEKFTFEGSLSIEVSVTEPTREIVLHAADLEFKASDVIFFYFLQRGNPPLVPAEVRLDKDAETATIVFAEELPIGEATLYVDYSGTLNDKMAGFYRSKYAGSDGKDRYLATTQFEATDARRALPCWDEPGRKATFDISLIVPENMTALSNMPVIATTYLDNGKKNVEFAMTPVMSSYLLAFVVGELEYVETKTNNGTLVRVYTTPGKSTQGEFALDVAKKTLEFYNEYFGIPYPLPKLDMIAIPDFAAGAMENWGLVTYRENAVLIDPDNSSAAAYQRVAEVVTHELAHQWFGNLVTMGWWTNLWLNEGFATWMANFAMDKLFPEWDIWTQFVNEEYASALSLDGLRSTHPIEVEVGHPDEISQIFDAISYSKGASVIRMIHDYIGAEAFRAGLQIYLKRHAYGNASTEDLWNALSETSGLPVGKIMDTWTKQPGYPLITVSRGDSGERFVSQKRFLAGGEKLGDEEFSQKWEIPLAYQATKLGTKNSVKLSERILCSKDGLTLALGDHSGLKLNIGHIALARVNYETSHWNELSRTVAKGELQPIDRYGILSDATALTRAGQLGTDQLLGLLSSYKNEENHTVWTAILGVLGALDNILEETPEEAKLASFARNLLLTISEKLGWEQRSGEPYSTRLLRGQVLGALGNYGHPETVRVAKQRFAEHSSGVRTLEPDLRTAVYGISAKNGYVNSFDTVVGLYVKEGLQEEKVRLLNALGKFTPPLTASALDYGFNSGKVRPGDFIYLLAGMDASAKNRRAAWKFAKDNWEKISERYSGGGLKMLARVVGLLCNNFTSFSDAEEVEKFFADHPVPSATRAIAEALERIRVRAAWYERDKDKIASALSLA